MSHPTNVLLIPVDKQYDLDYPDLEYIHIINTDTNNVQRNKTSISTYLIQNGKQMLMSVNT
jgi:hypothetical protein